MSKSSEYELEHGSVIAKCCMHRWATVRTAQKISHRCFCPACNTNVCIGCHKLLRKLQGFFEKEDRIMQQVLGRAGRWHKEGGLLQDCESLMHMMCFFGLHMPNVFMIICCASSCRIITFKRSFKSY